MYGDYNPDHQMVIREVRYIAMIVAPLFTIAFAIAGAIKFAIVKRRRKKRTEDIDKVIEAVTTTIKQQKEEKNE